MSAQNVTVCVRVRPLNEREKKQGLDCVINMEGNRTTIDNQHGKVHKFFFDYSFWSANRDDDHFADQEYIFDKIGSPLLDRCMEGYNCCLFAYGQTSSGKSYRWVAAVLSSHPDSLWQHDGQSS